jgi:hypothetical protein
MDRPDLTADFNAKDESVVCPTGHSSTEIARVETYLVCNLALGLRSVAKIISFYLLGLRGPYADLRC